MVIGLSYQYNTSSKDTVKCSANKNCRSLEATIMKQDARD